jgi:hypothetical protein
MTKNMGTVDRIVRALLAIVIIALYVAGQISGTALIVLGIVAAVFLFTSLIGFCPAYLPFGIKTTKGE